MSYFEEKFGIKIKNMRAEQKTFEEECKAGRFDMSAEQKTFEEECKVGRFDFNPDRSFDERCEIARHTAITSDMTYKERLAMLKRRYGL